MHSSVPRHPSWPRPARGLAVVATVILTSFVAACGADPFAVKASAKITADTISVFSMTGTPLGFPAALNTLNRTTVRIDPSFDFDIAFDIDAQNRAKLIPVRLVGGTATQSRQVGLRKLTLPFAEATLAPSSGYQFDSVLALSAGEGTFVQAQNPLCGVFTSQYVFSKLVIDSVSAARRTIYFQLVHDSNCGFRSLVPGEVPKN